MDAEALGRCAPRLRYAHCREDSAIGYIQIRIGFIQAEIQDLPSQDQEQDLEFETRLLRSRLKA